MFILGINGWPTRSHDPSACLVKDGKILAMAEEERFIRQKHAFEKLPINAIGYCLDEAGISLDDIDIIAFGWDYRLKYDLRKIAFNYNENKLLNILFPRQIFRYNKKPKLLIVPHHLAHAASVFFTSGYKEAAILIIDGQGENTSTSIAYGSDKTIKILKSFSIQHSLGYFYESINTYIGFHYLDSGKTMGLAPYGKSIFNFQNIELKKDGYRINLPHKLRYDVVHLDEQEALVALWHKELTRYISKQNEVTYSFNPLTHGMKSGFAISQQYKDLAASAQGVLEKVINHLTNISLDITKSNNMCIAGGVGLNCTANGKLLSNKGVKSLYIFPSADDAGVSAGAALYASSLYGRGVKFSKLERPYLGPSYTNNQVKEVLHSRKINYRISHNSAKEVADLLSKDKIIGWFQGRMEIGPRALGNRSILASPLHRAMWRRVNTIKGRELWRPLSPSILDEYKDEYFQNARFSPFMLQTFQVKQDKKLLIPAVVHVDGTTRPQTVSKKGNSRFWNLINEFYKITGVPVLLNTSFNGSGEPIVCGPQDALTMFYNSGLDYLVINDFIISK